MDRTVALVCMLPFITVNKSTVCSKLRPSCFAAATEKKKGPLSTNMYYSAVFFKKQERREKSRHFLVHLSDVCGNKNTTAAWERHHLKSMKNTI